MKAQPLNTLSATQIAGGIAAGAFTAEQVVADCLARIAAREPQIHAFAHVDPALAPAILPNTAPLVSPEPPG